jgi:RNA polymerase sigma factor (sigma-70 family)
MLKGKGEKPVAGGLAMGSVTRWFGPVREADSLATDALWKRYYPQLVRLARKQLGVFPRRAADEEDVALSAIYRFFSAAREDRFPDLADRYDLWRLLLWMTTCKVVDLKRREARQCRGGGRVKGESALGSPEDPATVAKIIGKAPTPEFVATMKEQCRRLLERLPDPCLQTIAVAKMQGYTNKEIAKQFGCSVRTVERQLNLIRKAWKEEKPE